MPRKPISELSHHERQSLLGLYRPSLEPPPAANERLTGHKLKISINASSDIYCLQIRPSGITTSLPTLFYIPGTASVAVCEAAEKTIAAHLATTLNCQVIVILHRLSCANKYPFPLNDISQTIHYFINHHAEYNIHLESISIGGYSSGGLLAIQLCLLCLHARHILFRQLLLIAPLTNLSLEARPYDQEGCGFFTEGFFRSIVSEFLPDGESPDSPIFSPIKNPASAFRNFPATTIIYGEKDCLASDIKTFSKLLLSQEVDSVLIPLGDHDHGFPWEEAEYMHRFSDRVKEIFSRPCPTPFTQSLFPLRVMLADGSLEQSAAPMHEKQKQPIDFLRQDISEKHIIQELKNLYIETEIISQEEKTQWVIFLQRISSLLTKHPLKIFISYAPTADQKLESRLAHWHENLTTAGIKNIFWHVIETDESEQEIIMHQMAASDVILVIGTPSYKMQTTEENTNCAMECAMLLSHTTQPDKKIILLWLEGDVPQDSFPQALLDLQLPIKNCRDPLQHAQKFAQDLLPEIFNSKMDARQSAAYERYWEGFKTAVWHNEDTAIPSIWLSLKTAATRVLANDQDFQKNKPYYVIPDIREKPESNHRKPLTNFLADCGITAPTQTVPPKLIWLFGDSGAGKSTLLKELELDLWQRFSTIGCIPIRIDLSEIDSEPKDFLAIHLNKLGYPDALLKKFRDMHLCLLLDGFDELIFRQKARNLIKEAKLLTWRVTTIITCRTQLECDTYDIDQYIENQGYPKPVRSYLYSLTSEQINECLTKRLIHATDPRFTQTIINLMNQSKSIKALVENPLLLKIVSEVLPTFDFSEIALTGNSETELTSYFFYEKFTDNWSKNECGRLMRDVQSDLQMIPREKWEQLLRQCTQFIALQMFQNATIAFTRNQLKEAATTILASLARPGTIDYLVNLLINTCPLKKTDQAKWQFTHKSFQEFYVAQSLWELVEIMNETQARDFAIDQLKKQPIQSEPKVLDFLREAWQANPEQAKKLRALFIKVILYSKDHHEISQSSANAATLLNAMGEYLNDLNDWQGVQLPGADLSYGRLWNTDLSHANLGNAVLAHATLVGANLSGAILKGIDLGDATTNHSVTDTISTMAKHPSKPWPAVGQKENIVLYDYLTGEIIGTPMIGHSSEVTSIAFSSDGHLLVSAGGSDKSCRLWDVSTQTLKMPPLSGHVNKVEGVAFSRDDKWFASISQDKICRLWNTTDGQLHSHHQTKDLIKTLAFSPSEDLLVLGTGQDCQFLTVPALTVRHSIKCHTRSVDVLAFSPDGSFIASGGLEPRDQRGYIFHTIRFWDVLTHSQLGEIKGTSGSMDTFTFNTDGTMFISADSAFCHIWKIEHQGSFGDMPSQSLKSEQSIYRLAFAEHDHQPCVILGHKSKIFELWRLSDRKNLVGRPSAERYCAAHSNDGSNLLVIRNKTEEEGVYRLWDRTTQQTQGRAFEKFSNDGTSLLSPQRTWLISTGNNPKNVFSTNYRACHFWNVSTQMLEGEALQEGLDSAPIHSVTFNHHGTLLALGSADGTCRLWRASDQSSYGKVLREHRDIVHKVVFSPDDTLLASASRDKTCLIWDVDSQTALVCLIGHTEAVGSVAFSPDNIFIATCSADKTCRVWQVGDWQFINRLEGHIDAISSIAFQPNSKSDELLLASGSYDKTCRLWRMQHGQLKLSAILCGHKLRILSIAFNHAGTLLASASGHWQGHNPKDPDDEEYNIRLWHVMEQKTVQLLRIFVAQIFDIQFSPDDLLLATAGEINGCHLWSLQQQMHVENTLQIPWSPPTRKEPNRISSVAFCPTEKNILGLAGLDGTCQLWDASRQIPIGNPLIEESSFFSCLAFSPNEEWLVSGHNEGTCRLWQVASRKSIGKAVKGHLATL